MTGIEVLTNLSALIKIARMSKNTYIHAHLSILDQLPKEILHNS